MRWRVPKQNARSTGTGGVTSAGPAPKPAKPRLLQDGRDMFWSLAPLVVGCILLAGLVGMCSFSARRSQPRAGPVLRRGRRPCGPTRRHWASRSGCHGCRRAGSPIPAAAAASRTATDPATVNGCTRHPRPSASSAPTGMYLSLTQSNADEDKLVGSIHPSMFPTGTVDVDGTSWVVYQGRRRAVEPVWTTRLTSPAGPTQIAITGAGNTDSSVRWRRLRNRSRRCPAASRTDAQERDLSVSAPEADLTGWSVAAVHRWRLHPRRLPQGLRTRGGADSRDPGHPSRGAGPG